MKTLLNWTKELCVCYLRMTKQKKVKNVYIRKLIETRLNHSDFKLYNREGMLVPREQVLREYNSLKAYLSKNCPGDNDSIAITLTKDYRYLLTMLASMEIGLTYIPLKKDYPQDRIEQIQSESKFTLLINDSNIEEIINYNGEDHSSQRSYSSSKPLYVIFTSGSTGKPKGVIIRRESLENFLKWFDSFYPDVTQEDKLLQTAEFSFDLSVIDLALFLTKNVEFHFSDFNNNIFRLAIEIEQKKISCLNTVPNNLNMFLSELVCERMDYSALKHFFIGGARFSFGLYEKCLKYFQPDISITNLYGPTECTVYSHAKKIEFNEKQDCFENNISIGHLITNCQALILNDGKEVSPGEKGELCIGGIQVMSGYINNPELTDKALIHIENEKYYRTGDIAFQDAEGKFYIVGRMDDTIKYRGFRINLLDIDSYITRMPYIQDSVTIAVENEQTENQTIAFLIMKEDKSVKEIKKDLGAILLDYQIPEKIHFVHNYPTNVSGKVCRKSLKADFLKSLEGQLK